MIEKRYVCDLCHATNAEKTVAYRISYHTGRQFSLASLDNSSASETVICRNCLLNLVEEWKRLNPEK